MWFKGQSLAVWLLALGQTLTYSGIYYSFPALLPDLQAGTGWTVAQLAFGPSLSFLVMAALTPFTGRLVDHGWGGEMLTYAPLVAGLGVLGLGLAPSVWAASFHSRLRPSSAGVMIKIISGIWK